MVDKLKELTNSDIEEIRKLHNAGKRHSWIAHKYGLRKKELSEITERSLFRVAGMYCTNCTKATKG